MSRILESPHLVGPPAKIVLIYIICDIVNVKSCHNFCVWLRYKEAIMHAFKASISTMVRAQEQVFKAGLSLGDI